MNVYNLRASYIYVGHDKFYTCGHYHIGVRDSKNKMFFELSHVIQDHFVVNKGYCRIYIVT